MAQIDIGKLTFTHKGDYAGGTAYVARDVVYYNGSAYIAKTSTTGNLPTSTAHWDKFADGSGGIWSAGLSLGSASQQLRVNSGASALEFFTPTVASSDFTKIYSNEITSGSPSSIDITNAFSATYDIYKLFFMLTLGSNDWFEVSFTDNSSITGGTYYSKSIQMTGNQTTSNQDQWAQNDTDGFRIANTWYATSTQHSDTMDMTIYDPFGSNRTQVYWNTNWNQADNNQMGLGNGIGRCSTAASQVGIKIKGSGGDIENNTNSTGSAYVALYGLKK